MRVRTDHVGYRSNPAKKIIKFLKDMHILYFVGLNKMLFGVARDHPSIVKFRAQ